MKTTLTIPKSVRSEILKHAEELTAAELRRYLRFAYLIYNKNMHFDIIADKAMVYSMEAWELTYTDDDGYVRPRFDLEAGYLSTMKLINCEIKIAV